MEGKSIVPLVMVALKAKRTGSTAIYVDSIARQKFLQEALDKHLPDLGLVVYYRPPANPRRPQ